MRRLWALARWGGLVIGLLLSYGPLYFDAQDTQKLGLSWNAWLALGVTIFALSAASVIAGLWRENTRLMTTPEPRLIFGEPNVRKVYLGIVETRAAAMSTALEPISGIPDVPVQLGEKFHVKAQPFVAVTNVANDPAKRAAEAQANQVVISLTFYREGDDEPLVNIYGRWTDNEQPGTREFLAPIDDIRRRNLIPNAEPNHIDIAIKHEDDEDCYAFNDETCRNFPEGWRDPSLRLSGERFRVHLVLKGVGMEDDPDQWYVLRNLGKGKGMELERSKRPSWLPNPDKEDSPR